jgi:hypothetical protein
MVRMVVWETEPHTRQEHPEIQRGGSLCEFCDEREGAAAPLGSASAGSVFLVVGSGWMMDSVSVSLSDALFVGCQSIKWQANRHQLKLRSTWHRCSSWLGQGVSSKEDSPWLGPPPSASGWGPSCVPFPPQILRYVTTRVKKKCTYYVVDCVLYIVLYID